MTAQGGIGTRPTRIRVGSASKPPATARRATYFELSRPFLSHASPRHPAGRPASLFMTVRHGTRYAAMSYVGTAASADGSATRTTALCHEARRRGRLQRRRT